MKTIKIITMLLGIVLISGCGDQFWCGDNGCASYGGGKIAGLAGVHLSAVGTKLT